MSLLQLAYVIALRRIISSWRLELVLLLGIVLAVALMSSGVVFSDLLADAAVHRALEQASPEEANFSVRKYYDLDDPSTTSRRASVFQRSSNFVQQRVGARFQPYTQDRALLFETSTFYFQGHPQLELDDEVRPRGKITYMTDLLPNRIKVVQGNWPYSAKGSIPLSGEPLEIAVATQGAELLQLGVGDEMTIFPGARTRDWPPVKAKIVAIFERVNHADEFWYDAERTFPSTDHPYTWVPLFTTERAIFDWVGRAFPGLYTDITWFFYLDRNGIRGKDVNTIQQTTDLVRYDVGAFLGNGSSDIKLDKVLDDYSDQLLLARIPLFLMLFLVTAILIYYLALVAGLIVRSRSTEISVLKSRGSGTLQLGLLALVEGLLLAVPAVALGPLLALGVSRALGRIFFDVGVGGEIVPVVLSSRAFVLGLAGALLGVAVLTISTMVTARKGIVEFRQEGARPPEIPFFHRYYLDVLALALIGLVWWQIQSRGSFLVRNLGTGDLQIDFSLLLGPVLGLLALGLLVLRLFPIALALLAKMVEPLGPAWMVQGLKRVSRDPVIPGTLVVLLMLTTAMGVIGSAFSSTLERNQRERALYASGADLRIEHDRNRAPTLLLGLSDQVNGIDGVVSTVEVERASGSLLLSGFNPRGVSMLAVDTDAIADVAWYRPDLAGGKTIQDLAAAIRSDLSPPSPFNDGIRLPSDATTLAVWANPGRPDYNLTLRARLQDVNGYYFDVFIGRLIAKGWQRIEAPIIPSFSSQRRFGRGSLLPRVTPPYTLLGLHASSFRGSSDPGVIFLDELAVVTQGGEKILADSQTFENWQVIEDLLRPGLDALEPSEAVSRGGANRSMAFSWAAGSSGLRGIRAGGTERPIPAIVSKSFLDEADAQLGDTLAIAVSTVTLPVKAVALADYFPTLDPRNKPFIVVDLKAYNHYTNLHTLRPTGGSNELWVNLASSHQTPAAVTEVLKGRGLTVNEVHLATEMVFQRVEQPLVSAGWSGLLVLMFLALVLASASGVMLFTYMDTRERQTEFALLHTLGFSKAQLNSVVWFNLFLVVACGIGLGTWAGQLIGTSILPILEVAEGGTRVVPPMVLQTNWGTLLVSYMVLVGVTISAVVWLAWFTAKLDIQLVLRIGAA